MKSPSSTKAPVGADPYPKLAQVLQGSAEDINRTTLAIIDVLCSLGSSGRVAPPVLAMASLCAATYMAVGVVAADHRDRRAIEISSLVKAEARRIAAGLVGSDNALVDVQWPLITAEDLREMLGNRASVAGDLSDKLGVVASALSTSWARVFKHYNIDGPDAIIAITCAAACCGVLWTKPDQREAMIAEISDVFRDYCTRYAALLQSREQGHGTETRQ